MICKKCESEKPMLFSGGLCSDCYKKPKRKKQPVLRDPIKCSLCGQSFRQAHGLEKYCSEKCRESAIQQQLKKNAEARALKQHAFERQCDWCGAEFKTFKRRKITCSTECSVARQARRSVERMRMKRKESKK